MKCEVCGGFVESSTIDLGMHPLCDDLIPFGRPEVCNLYPINIAFCNNCLTAHQLFQVQKETLFPASYHYRARMTPSVLEFMDQFVLDVEVALKNLDGLTVLDIGCNDGSLLDRFRSKGCNTLGVDPTDAAIDARDSGHTILQAYFNKEVATQIITEYSSPDIITFTNVFAHIEDFHGLIEALKIVSNENTLFVIENHYMGSIFDSCQFDTFYHEHPRTYSATSFQHIADRLDRVLVGVQFPQRYGGNIRAWIGSPTSKSSLEHSDLFSLIPNETDFLSKFMNMSSDISEWTHHTKLKLTKLFRKYGRLPAKAFPGRAAILLKLLDLDYQDISAIYEIKGSIKTGFYAPGTRIPILPESNLYDSGYSGPIINLSWHISKEVEANLRHNGFMGEIIDIK